MWRRSGQRQQLSQQPSVSARAHAPVAPQQHIYAALAAIHLAPLYFSTARTCTLAHLRSCSLLTCVPALCSAFAHLCSCPLLPHRTEAREELRRELGTLRFDLNTLASAKDKTARKAALALRTEFLAKVGAGCPRLPCG